MNTILNNLKEKYGKDLKGEKYGDAPAVIGVDHHSCKIIFSVKKSIEFLMQRDGMSFSEAEEFVDFNYIGARGDDEPIWLDDRFSN
jgi:hypothetical protein